MSCLAIHFKNTMGCGEVRGKTSFSCILPIYLKLYSVSRILSKFGCHF